MDIYVLLNGYEDPKHPRIAGIFTNQPAMLAAVDDMISSDFAIAEDNTKQYGYSGFAYVLLEQLNQINANAVVHQIYWNADDVKSYLKE